VNLGNHHVIGLKADDCTDGTSMAVKQQTSEKRAEVLDPLDRAATSLRKDVGESLKSIQKFDTPLAQATTPSLEALKAYSLGSKLSG
jgi:hypothetical protein